MRQEPDMGNEMHLRDHVHSYHQLFPDDNDNESSDIYNLSPEVFDFRRRYISNFVFTHVNINSFRHKYPFIRDMLNKQSVDLLAISESKLDNSFTDSQFQVADYAIYRQDLTSSSGGLLVYVRADLPHRRLGKLEVNCQGFESLCLEITIGKAKTAFCCIYKHPKVKNDYFKKCVSNVWLLFTIVWWYSHFWGRKLLSWKIKYCERCMWCVWSYKSHKDTDLS